MMWMAICDSAVDIHSSYEVSPSSVPTRNHAPVIFKNKVFQLFFWSSTCTPLSLINSDTYVFTCLPKMLRYIFITDCNTESVMETPFSHTAGSAFKKLVVLFRCQRFFSTAHPLIYEGVISPCFENCFLI